MASVVRKDGSKYWFAAYRDHRTKQCRRSTRETDRKKALKLAEHWERIAQRKVKGDRVRETTEELLREYYPDEVLKATVRGFIDIWLATKTPEVSASTLVGYKKSAAKFLAFLGPAADLDISLIRKPLIVGFRNEVAQRVSADTVNFDLKVVQTIFRAAKADGYLLSDPAESVDTVRRASRTSARRELSLEQIRAVLEIADPEWKSLIKFGLYTGQRLSDLAALTWENVDLQRNCIRLTTRKTHKQLTIPLAQSLRTHILSLPSGEGRQTPLHPRAWSVVTTNAGNAGQLSNQFVDLLAAVGLRPARASHKATGKGGRGRRVSSELSFHSLRHTAVTLLKDANVPQATVQELIGHESPEISARYTHVGIEALTKAAAALPEI